MPYTVGNSAIHSGNSVIFYSGGNSADHSDPFHIIFGGVAVVEISYIEWSELFEVNLCI